MNVVPFEPSRATKARRFMKSFWAWWRFLLHHHDWVEVEHGPVSRIDKAGVKNRVGQYYIQQCSVCKDKRIQEMSIN